MNSNDAPHSSKEWHFSDEWEQFSSEDSIAFDDSSLANNEPLLNEDEIESLLGHFDTSKNSPFSGFEVLLKNHTVAYDKISFFNNILKDFSLKCLDLWRLTLSSSEKIDYLVEENKFISLKQYLDENLIKGLTLNIKSKQCDSPLFINFSQQCIYSILELLLGGCEKTLSFKTTERSLTKIENNIILHFLNSILSVLNQAFNGFIPYDFYSEKNCDFSMLLKLSDVADTALLTKFSLKIGSSLSFFNIIFPITFLENFIQKLHHKNDDSAQTYASIWQEHLAVELVHSNLLIEAKLPPLSFSLEEIFNWEVGTKISLPIKLSSLIPLECGGKEIMIGQLGHLNNSIAIQIKQNTLISEEEKR